MPDEPEVRGLLALMLATHARRHARLAPDGSIILLADQDRAVWDRAMIDEAAGLAEGSLRQRAAGEYRIQAAIACLHGLAPSYEETDFEQIAELYLFVEAVKPTPVVRVNRAVAEAQVAGPQRGARPARRRHGARSLAPVLGDESRLPPETRREGGCCRGVPPRPRMPDEPDRSGVPGGPPRLCRVSAPPADCSTAAVARQRASAVSSFSWAANCEASSSSVHPSSRCMINAILGGVGPGVVPGEPGEVRPSERDVADLAGCLVSDGIGHVCPRAPIAKWFGEIGIFLHEVGQGHDFGSVPGDARCDDRVRGAGLPEPPFERRHRSVGADEGDLIGRRLHLEIEVACDDVGGLGGDFPIGGELAPGNLHQTRDGLTDDMSVGDALAVDSPEGRRGRGDRRNSRSARSRARRGSGARVG